MTFIFGLLWTAFIIGVGVVGLITAFAAGIGLAIWAIAIVLSVVSKIIR